MKELSPLQINLRKVVEAKEFPQEAKETEDKIHAFLWDKFSSILDNFFGKEAIHRLEKRIILRSPSGPDYSEKHSFIRNLLGLQDQKKRTYLLATIRRSFELSTRKPIAFLIKLETREDKVAQRKSIIFQITKHGTEERTIWGTRMFIGGIERGEEISTELNQANKSFERLENGLHLLNFISN